MQQRHKDPSLPRRFFSVQWDGFWFLPRATTVELYAGGDDGVDVAVDGQRILRRNIAVGMHTVGETITLSAGAHEILVRYRQEGGGASLNIQYAVDGETPGALWVNWRIIPRAMSGLVPNRPLTIMDLGCGIGSSTSVLAFYSPQGSRILAYEMSRPLVNIASTRAYLDRSGERADVRFHCQSITTPLYASDSTSLGQRIDLANSSGVLGHHFNLDTMQLLAAQLKTVVRPGGLAMLDSGPTLSASDLAGIMTSAGFVEVRRCHSWPLDPTALIVFQSPDPAQFVLKGG